MDDSRKLNGFNNGRDTTEGIGGQPPLNFEIPPSRRKHHEMIKCPECKKLQIAIVQHTVPFFTYIHECCECKYTIMESEWNKKIKNVPYGRR